MKKLLAVAALLGSMSTLSARAAILVPTGGTLNHMSPDSIPAAYGEFSSEYQATLYGYLHGSVEWTTELATLGTLQGHSSATSLQIAGEAHTVDGDVMMTPGGVHGVLGFDLTEPALVSFSFAHDRLSYANSSPDVSITLRNAADQIALSCVSADYSAAGGCLGGSQHDGAIQLGAGHYDLYFDASAYGVASGGSYTTFSFGLTTVPIPGTVWLLASGLGLLVRRRRACRDE